MRFGRAIALLALAVAAGHAALAQSPVELYRRAVPLEATTGVISIRQSVAREIDVPAECDDGEMECRATRRFARVWRIDFEVETRKMLGGELLVEREERGTAHLALAAGRADEESYDEYLRESLARVGAAAFDEPFAGLKPARRPFDGPVSIRSAEPSWSCFENGTVRRASQYTRGLSVGADGVESVSSSGSSSYGEEIAGPLCSALGEATMNAFPEVIRTMSTPRVLVEEVLSVHVSDLLRARAYADELVALPEGSWLARKEVPGVGRSRGRSNRGEIIESRLAVDEVETSARIMPARLPTAAARVNAWHSRWTLETLERRLGPLPEARVIESWSVTASLMPTLPPRDLDRDDEEDGGAVSEDPYPVRLDPALLFTSVGESLDFRAEMSPEVLAEAIAHKIAGLKTSGWILVLCRDDAEATWGLAPTHGRARLLNDDAFCAEVEAQLP